MLVPWEDWESFVKVKSAFCLKTVLAVFSSANLVFSQTLIKQLLDGLFIDDLIFQIYRARMQNVVRN